MLDESKEAYGNYASGYLNRAPSKLANSAKFHPRLLKKKKGKRGFFVRKATLIGAIFGLFVGILVAFLESRGR